MAIYFGQLEENEQKEKTMLISNDGKNQQIWMSNREWTCPKEIISAGSEMPDEVLLLLDKWSKDVDKIREDFQYDWDIKHAAVEFIYGNVFYKLQPSAIAATQEQFDYFSKSIQNDLKEIGCPYTAYRGFLD